MSLLKTTNPVALRVLFSEDIYFVDDLGEQAIVEQPIVEVKESIVFNYLGENNKYFVILVNDPAVEHINSKDLDALTSILAAKKMEIRDVAILNYAKYPKATFSDVKSYFVNTRLVLFGINPQQLGLPAMESNKICDHENVKVLASFSFAEMQADPSKKRIFWNEMKLL